MKYNLYVKDDPEFECARAVINDFKLNKKSKSKKQNTSDRLQIRNKKDFFEWLYSNQNNCQYINDLLLVELIKLQINNGDSDIINQENKDKIRKKLLAELERKKDICYGILLKPYKEYYDMGDFVHGYNDLLHDFYIKKTTFKLLSGYDPSIEHPNILKLTNLNDIRFRQRESIYYEKPRVVTPDQER